MTQTDSRMRLIQLPCVQASCTPRLAWEHGSARLHLALDTHDPLFQSSVHVHMNPQKAWVHLMPRAKRASLYHYLHLIQLGSQGFSAGEVAINGCTHAHKTSS